MGIAHYLYIMKQNKVSIKGAIGEGKYLYVAYGWNQGDTLKVMANSRRQARNIGDKHLQSQMIDIIFVGKVI